MHAGERPPGDDDLEEPGAAERHPRRKAFMDAAIEAEFETPPREPTVQAAKASLVKRVARLVGGVVLIILGLVMMVTPGPGLIAIAAGLALLAEDVPFARRLLDQVRARIPENEDGNISVWVWVFSGAMIVLALGASIWWYVLR